MLKLIVIAIVVLIAAVLLFAATRPNDFRVQRSVLVQAPPERIHAQINDFHHWQAWSPYEKLDPAMTRSIGGAAQGTGATYGWSGEGKAGAGRMEITRSEPASRITIQLDFTRPFKAHNVAEFTIAPKGDASEVTWAMSGQQPYMAKLMGLFFDMDHMIGRDFEEGLNNLKRIAEQ
ncbi:SRPBCC family protein [Lysobacter cavernae]|uniref:SRPBCC family protein n=1 Tax=Lysobacter cavernae TaxID=1685901 RepID=A0ABV7RN84_9GAMM